MVLAAFRDTGYNIVLLLHIIAVVIALAPAVVHPILFGLEQQRADADLVGLARRVTGVPARVYTIALAIAGLLGFALISMSDDVIEWGDTWVGISIVLWIALNGVFHAVLIPAEQAMANGDTAAVARANRFGPLAIVLALVLLYLMALKPG